MSISVAFSRRGFFRGLACGCLAAGAVTSSTVAFAADSAATASPSARDALARLKTGNAAFVEGGACIPAGGPKQISKLATGQAPFAVVVGCSDSRTPPEHLFDASLGELFVVRVAGNTVDDAALGSIEYGVAVLGAPLVLVLGHSGCGAVEAGVNMVTKKTLYPGSIGTMIEPILPAVLKAQGMPGDIVANSVRTNVQMVLAHIAQGSVMVSGAEKAGKVQLVGGVYDLATGKVDFLG